jgi:hypothetical protein
VTGIDRNHVEQNILTTVGNLPEENRASAKSTVMQFLRDRLYLEADAKKAGVIFDEMLNDPRIPQPVREYMRKNKRGVILHKLTLAARKKILMRNDGEVDFPWTQGSESAHMILRRRIPGMRAGKAGFLAFLHGMTRYFEEKLTSLRSARSEYVLGRRHARRASVGICLCVG